MGWRGRPRGPPGPRPAGRTGRSARRRRGDGRRTAPRAPGSPRRGGRPAGRRRSPPRRSRPATGRWSRARSIASNASSVVTCSTATIPRSVAAMWTGPHGAAITRVRTASSVGRGMPAVCRRASSPRPTRGLHSGRVRRPARPARRVQASRPDHRPVRRHRRDGPRQQRGLPDLLRDRPDPLLDRRDRRADRARHRGRREPDPRRGAHHLPRAGVPRRDRHGRDPRGPDRALVVHARAPAAGGGPRRAGAAGRGQRIDPGPLRLCRPRPGRASGRLRRRHRGLRRAPAGRRDDDVLDRRARPRDRRPRRRGRLEVPRGRLGRAVGAGRGRRRRDPGVGERELRRGRAGPRWSPASSRRPRSSA